MAEGTDKGHIAGSVEHGRETLVERVDGDTELLDGVVEVYLSSEISERALTKDRPDLSYGTSSKVGIRFVLGEDGLIAGQRPVDLVQQLHEQQEAAMQIEIGRRKWAKANGAGTVEALFPTEPPTPYSDENVPF